VLAEVGKVIVGQNYMVERILIGLLTGGHVLLEGVPGLAKTLTVNTVASIVNAQVPAHPVHAGPAARRPHRHDDLPPGDRRFTAKKGPIFANLVLADEINRAPAKVQSALLEAMQEKQVTIGETSYPLTTRSW
jgi:MoxR-like ATPase